MTEDIWSTGKILFWQWRYFSASSNKTVNILLKSVVLKLCFVFPTYDFLPDFKETFVRHHAKFLLRLLSLPMESAQVWIYISLFSHNFTDRGVQLRVVTMIIQMMNHTITFLRAVSDGRNLPISTSV